MVSEFTKEDPRYEHRLMTLEHMTIHQLVIECNRLAPAMFAHEKIASHLLVLAILEAEGFTD